MDNIILKASGELVKNGAELPIGHELDILRYLGETIELDAACTLRSYFKMLEKYKALQFIDPFIPSYLAEYLKCPKKCCIDSDMEYLSLEYSIIYDPKRKSKYDLDEIEISTTFHGKSAKDGYAIEFSPLKKLLDYPLKLERGVFYKFDPKLKIQESKFDYYFKLWDLVHEIIWELSFMGIPKQRDKKSKEIMGRIKDIKEHPEKLIPAKEVFKKLKNKIAKGK